MTRLHRRAIVAVFFTVLQVLMLAATEPAQAQVAKPPPTVSLVAQRREFIPPTATSTDLTTAPTDLLGPDGFVLDLLLEGTQPLKGSRIALTVFQRVRTRAAFTQAADSADFGSPIGFVSTTTPDARGTEDLVVTSVRIPVGIPSVQCPLCINIGDGVYPVSVELRNVDEETVDRFTTFVTGTVPGTVTSRLQVGLLVPLQAAPSIKSARDIAPVQSARSLISMVEALASQRQVPLSIVAVPQSLDQLEPTNDDGKTEPNGLLDLLRLVLPDREVLSNPYVRVVPEIIDDASFQPYRRALFALGAASLKQRLSRDPVDGIMIAPALLNSDQTLDELNITRLIVGPNALEGSPDDLPLATPIIVDPGARSGNTTAARPAVVLDDAVAQRFTKKMPGRTSTSDDQLRAQHVIAELALIETLTRDVAQRGTPIAVPPETTQATLVAVLNELAASSRLAPTLVTTLFDSPPHRDSDGAPVLYTPRSAPSTNDGRLLQRRNNTIANYAAIDERNTGYASLFGAAGPDPQQARTAAEIANLRREAATLLANDFTEAQRSAATRAVRTEFDRLLDRVANQSSRRVTLTARSQEIPISLVNDTGRPITISMIVETENADLPRAKRDPNVPARQVLQELISISGRVHEQPVTVATKGPGRYSMLVRLQTPSGYEFSRTRYTLQATSIGALGKALTAGSLLFLGIWWAATISQNNRKRSALRHPANTTKPPPQRTQRR